MLRPHKPSPVAAARRKERLDRIALLRESAETAARHVRNLYVSFLLVSVYLAIAVGSTTHEQLLRKSALELPVFKVGLPLLGFYGAVPILFLLLHFHLLLQFYLLSRKLYAFDGALRALPKDQADEQRGTLFPLAFSHRLLGRHYPGDGRRAPDSPRSRCYDPSAPTTGAAFPCVGFDSPPFLQFHTRPKSYIVRESRRIRFAQNGRDHGAPNTDDPVPVPGLRLWLPAGGRRPRLCAPARIKSCRLPGRLPANRKRPGRPPSRPASCPRLHRLLP